MMQVQDICLFKVKNIIYSNTRALTLLAYIVNFHLDLKNARHHCFIFNEKLEAINIFSRNGTNFSKEPLNSLKDFVFGSYSQKHKCMCQYINDW